MHSSLWFEVKANKGSDKHKCYFPQETPTARCFICKYSRRLLWIGKVNKQTATRFLVIPDRYFQSVYYETQTFDWRGLPTFRLSRRKLWNTHLMWLFSPSEISLGTYQTKTLSAIRVTEIYQTNVSFDAHPRELLWKQLCWNQSILPKCQSEKLDR